MGLAVTIATLAVMTVITNCEGTGKIAGEHSYDKIAVFAIGSNILMTIIFCRTLLYVYRQLRMDRDIKLGAKSDRAKWPDSNNGTMTKSSLEHKQDKSIGSWAEQSRVHWGKLCLVTTSVRGQDLDGFQREVFCTPISAWLGLTQHHVGRKSAIIVSEKGIKEWTSKMQTLGAKIKKLQIAKQGSIPIIRDQKGLWFPKWDPS